MLVREDKWMSKRGRDEDKTILRLVSAVLKALNDRVLSANTFWLIRMY